MDLAPFSQSLFIINERRLSRLHRATTLSLS
jgi:hypothetical protein